MNKTTNVKRRQSLLDISIQQTGVLEDIFRIVEKNDDISITDDLVVGRTITTDTVTNKMVADYFRVNEIKPATGITAEDSVFLLGGINFMGIEIDFIVS